MIGATTSQTLDLTLINKGDMIYGTSTIKVEIGLKVGSTIEYIPMGIYNIDDIEKTDYTIKITAFDNMIKFERNFTTNLGENLTLQQVVSELERITGVQFTGSLPSYTVKKLEGFTCREILGYVASLCGGNAVITREGKFTIVTPNDINYSINTSNYFDYKREETKYKIGKISCQVGEEVLSKGSLGTDSMELQFENPWVTNSILQDIYNKLNGFEYLGYSMKWQGDLSLDLGDIVTITDKKGVVRKHPILSQKFNYTGGLTSEISAKGENKNKNEFSSSGSTAKKVERVVMELALINKALIDVAYIGDLTAGNIKFDTASGNTLDLQTLLSKFVTGENGQFLNLTTDNVTISNAVIKDIIAKNISVEDLKAGTINTNNINLVSADGGLSIVGPTMQFKDKNNKVRLQLGQDAAGDFNFILRAADGTTTLIDGYGIKEKAIADKLIKSNMVADGAIGEQQINYSSLITGLNKDTNTSLIKASKVALDLTGQSLEVSFNSLKSNVDSKESRNYIRNGNALTNRYFSFLGIEEVEGKRCFYQTHKGTGERYIATSKYNLEELARKTVTLSFLAKQTSNLRESEVFILSRKKGSTRDWDYAPYKKFIYSTEKLTKYTWVYTFPSDIDRFYIRWDNNGSIDGLDATVWITDIKLEVGENSNPIWTPAPEDIEEKIQANTTSITAVQGQISGLISESSIIKGDVTTLKDNYTSLNATVNGINTTVASHTSSIGTLNNNLNAVSGKVTTVENKQATLEQNLEGFKTTVSNTYSTKTELNNLSGTVSSINSRVSTAESSINQLNNKIALKVEQTDIEEAINALEIGGRNLLLNSYEIVTPNYATDGDNFSYYDDKTCDLIAGETYIVKGICPSGLNWSDRHVGIGSTNAVLWLRGKNGSHQIISSNTTGTTGTTFTVSVSQRYTLRTNVYKAGQYTFSKIKIEKGNVATDWTPAPEDIDKAITAVDGRVTTLNTSLTTTNNKVATIETSLNSITSRVSSTENSITTINGNISSLQTRMSTAEQKITDSAIVSTVRSSTSYQNDLNAKASITDVSNLTTRVNSVEQSITATALTTTISSALNGSNSITTTKFTMDKDGLTIKNGGFKILNTSNYEVLGVTTEGILTVKGNIFVNGDTGESLEVTPKEKIGNSMPSVYSDGYGLGVLRLMVGYYESLNKYIPPQNITTEIDPYTGVTITDNVSGGSTSIIGGKILSRIIEVTGDIYNGSYSKSTNGYTKLPNGMILQWGEFSFSDMTNYNPRYVNFPIKFPNQCFTVVGNVSAHDGNTNPRAIPYLLWNNNQSNFFYRIMKIGLPYENTLTIARCSWIAIGY